MQMALTLKLTGRDRQIRLKKNQDPTICALQGTPFKYN